MQMIKFTSISGHEGVIYFSEVNNRFVKVAKVEMFTSYGEPLWYKYDNSVFSSVNMARNFFKREEDEVGVKALVDYGSDKGVDVYATAMEMCYEMDLSEQVAVMLNFADIKRALDCLEV